VLRGACKTGCGYVGLEGLRYVETANLHCEINLSVKFCNAQMASFDCAGAVVPGVVVGVQIRCGCVRQEPLHR
jgi:hypothetical protein